MTNREILKADLLDILFENRNKDYGAYALRRGYDKRLLTALGAAMLLIILFVLISAFGKKNTSAPVTYRKKSIVEITEIKMPVEKPKEQVKEQPKPKVQAKPVPKVATEKFTSKIEIKPDNKVKEQMPEMAILENKVISDKKETGKPDDGIPKEIKKPVETGNGNAVTGTEVKNEFRPDERNPEFPGGPEALKRFLASNLQTPSDLEDGEKKTVLIRFKVDKDGAVNTFEIVTSGGGEFDREVVRVCKRMPRWTPAVQNGMNVPVSYVLPVTFVGAEQ